ncbi:MAG: hypothetical protein AB7U81_15735 [Thiohalomonadaceae bacterium]
MGSKALEHLTPQEAKERLRTVARETGLVPWVRRQPMDAILVAVVGGFVLGGIPRLWSMVWGTAVGRRVGRKVAERIV